ncbi:MAG: adenylosuccinate synthase [Chloroflexia bacterium]|nr:adenylosuccinate synthase [Chloroflexia bacterium]
MTVQAVIGGQWGDEGKGKIVDLLTSRAEVVARYQGGDNAGHTVVNPYGTFHMHLIPSGIFSSEVTCIIGNGVVVNPQRLIDELVVLRQHKISIERLFISEAAHVILPFHPILDQLEEESRGNSSIGTTHRGIGPAYTDKAARVGIRMVDLLDEEILLSRLTQMVNAKNRLLTKVYNHPPLSLHEIYLKYLEYGRQLAPHIRDTRQILMQALREDKRILLEGAQGTMLDLDFGTYPYVTSSSPSIGGACTGLGIPPARIQRVMAVCKAYCTRVGAGPFPTEAEDEIAEGLRERGHEFGTTTGRARRCGWFDAVAARYVVDLNGVNSLAITKLDVLDEEPVVRICTGYRLNDAVVDYVSTSQLLWESLTPVYEDMPGWQSSTRQVRAFEDLPEQAQTFLRRIEEIVGTPIAIISVGPKREESIIRQTVF